MSFAAETEKLIEQLIQAEYKNACLQAGKEFNDEYTDKYHSLYEGYSILKEEVEEVEACIKQLKNEIDYIWTCIKRNKIKVLKYSVDDCFNEFTNNSSKELAQVGAVLMKIKNTLEVKE